MKINPTIWGKVLLKGQHHERSVGPVVPVLGLSGLHNPVNSGCCRAAAAVILVPGFRSRSRSRRS